MIKYEDLLGVPYKRGGRDITTGLDCYGFCIECFSRAGKILKDIAATPQGDLAEYILTVNAKIIDEYIPDCGAQFLLDDRLHVGYMLNKREILHMTYKGVRITPIFALGKARFFEVINESNSF